MPGETDQPLVAIVEASEALIRLLQALFEGEGFRTATASVEDFRRGRLDPDQFFAQHRPRVTVFDISVPYEEHWAFFQELQRRDSVRGGRFVLITTNKRAVDELAGPTRVYEVIGKPFDLEILVAAVRRVLDAG